MKLFVDNLTVIDCSYLHPAHGVEGESWICDVVLVGDLDEQSMIMDFGPMKKQIKRAIDDWVDHTLLVPLCSPCLKIQKEETGGIYLEWQCEGGEVIRHRSPASALCLLEVEDITKDTLGDYLETQLMEVVNKTVERVEVTLREEIIDGPYYHYSHGLKKHDGHCRRIAHGHRSKIEIWRDGELAIDLMAQWAEQWKHVYIGSAEDVVEEKDGRIQFAYRSGQEAFMLELPRRMCEVIEADSTVECIAQHIARTLKAQHPSSRFMVKAYEGVNKGAMVNV